MISIITNVSLYDALRIKIIVPHWLRVFEKVLSEIIIVFDEKKPEGRITGLHKKMDKQEEVLDTLKFLTNIDHRIKFSILDYSKIDLISKRWFKRGSPNRCQAGTPIFPFIYGIEEAKETFILKTDCDMVFFNNGFLDEAIRILKLNKIDLIEPPRIYKTEEFSFSTRAFFINYPLLNKKLPIKAHKLDPLRQIHRFLNGRSSYLALEEILQREFEKERIKCYRLKPSTGYSMHIPRRDQFENENINTVITLFETGNVPDEQKNNSWDYNNKFWL